MGNRVPEGVIRRFLRRQGQSMVATIMSGLVLAGLVAAVTVGWKTDLFGALGSSARSSVTLDWIARLGRAVNEPELRIAYRVVNQGPRVARGCTFLFDDTNAEGAPNHLPAGTLGFVLAPGIARQASFTVFRSGFRNDPDYVELWLECASPRIVTAAEFAKINFAARTVQWSYSQRAPTSTAARICKSPPNGTLCPLKPIDINAQLTPPSPIPLSYHKLLVELNHG